MIEDRPIINSRMFLISKYKGLLKEAFMAGSNWKEKYKKTVDDNIDVPDFDKRYDSVIQK